jgi:hypothetical protein
MAAVRAVEEEILRSRSGHLASSSFSLPTLFYPCSQQPRMAVRVGSGGGGSAAAPLASARVRLKPRAALSRGATVVPFADRSRAVAWFGRLPARQRGLTTRSFPVRWRCRQRDEGPGRTPCSSSSLLGFKILGLGFHLVNLFSI